MAAKKSSSLPVTVLRGHSRPVTALSFATIASAHKSLILSGDSEGHVKLWSLETSREAFHQAEKAHSAGILSIERMNMNASQVVTSARDGLIKVWDMESFPKVISQISLSKETKGEGGHCFCNVSPLKSATYEDSCSPLICSSNSSGSEILLFDMRSQTSSPVLRFNLSDYVREGDLLMNLLFRRTNTHCADQIIGAFDSGHMIAFDTRSTRCLSVVRIQQSTIVSIDSSFKDDGIAAVGAGSELTRHCLSSPACDADKTEFKLKHAVKLPTEGASCVRHRSDGRLLAVALWDASVRLYDCSRLKPLATLRYQREAVDTIAFLGGLGNKDEEVSPWKGRFATGSKDGSIALWDTYANTAQ